MLDLTFSELMSRGLTLLQTVWSRKRT